ncbi:MAG: glycosyltransferase [Phenylobacterium sp.]|uniref:glycosyltransferase n=1 Tax=Phenylobacterium sp. TaxID=1871053 RepID=UPI003918A527
MSVLHLLGTAGEGGAETYFVDLVRALAEAGVDQAAALRANPGRQAALAQAGVPAEVFRFGGPIDLFTRPQVARFARRQEVKAALAWMNRAARHTPKGPWARIGRLGGYYSLKYYKGFDVLVANTEHIADWIVEQGWPAGQVRYIPNFADAPDEAAPADRAALDTPAEAPLLLGMGRLHEVKAHDVSLKALVGLPQAYLWIAGAGPQEAKLKALATALGVADRVRFLGWRNDASALYRAADVCVFPSRYEPLGNVVIQAWAHGLPVVAAASQGPSALIRDGDDGLLVPVDEAEALAEAVRRVLDEPMLRIRLVQHGAERVEADFSRAAVVARWRDLFADLGAG